MNWKLAMILILYWTGIWWILISSDIPKGHENNRFSVWIGAVIAASTWPFILVYWIVRMVIFRKDRG